MGATHLSWEDVAPHFDARDGGVLPDVHVPGTSVEDWQSLFDLVRERGWGCEYREGFARLPFPSAAEVFSRSAEGECVEVYVRPVPDVLAIFRAYSAEEIDFDVDLRELQGQDRLDILCDFLSAVGRRLGKPVIMTAEGFREFPILEYDPAADRVVLSAAES
ncbi:hypothetical protein [Nocardia bhagyanarayanae]|uniref:hypothetical protein n=1 Tax=Nocardia bhagyanarayanae TaxID=1215925 RepID=UPI001FEB2E23|nr:hypothetical protein [Nocardia bhagyanarayanae]